MSDASEKGGEAVPDDAAPLEPAAEHPTAPVGPVLEPRADDPIFATLAAGQPLDGDDAWPARARRTGLRLPVPVLLLSALVVAAGAFWGGAAVQRADGTVSSTSGAGAAASRIAALFGGGSGSSRTGNGTAGAGGFGGATAPAASGTVTAVVGNTIYLTTSSGTIVKVQVPSTATVDRNAKASVGALKSGDTIVVEGSTSKSGVVTATSVSASAPGVSSATRGAFGVGGGAGGLGGTGGGTGGFGGGTGTGGSGG